MSKYAWSVLVSVFFAIVTTVTPIPDRLRPWIVSGAWMALILSSFGWFLAYIRSDTTWKLPASPAILVIVGSIAAALAICIFLVFQPKPTLQASEPNHVLQDSKDSITPSPSELSPSPPQSQTPTARPKEQEIKTASKQKTLKSPPKKSVESSNTVISAPHGIAIGGSGTVNNPTVNNYVPEAPEPRRILQAAGEAIIADLKAIPSKPAILMVVVHSNLSEPAQFGEQVKSVLLAAGWNVAYHYIGTLSISVYPPPSEPILPDNGLQCYSVDPHDASMAAFQAALLARARINCPAATTVPMWFRSHAQNEAKEFVGGIFVGKQQ